MHGIPNDFEEKPLIGLTLEQLSITANTLSFSFGNDVLVTVEGKIEYQASAKGKIKVLDIIAAPALVASLISHQIVDASIDDDRKKLNLKFENGAILRFVDEGINFESFSIQIPGKVIYI